MLSVSAFEPHSLIFSDCVDITGEAEGLYGAQLFISDGVHKLFNPATDAKLIAVIYGTDDRESYGFPVRYSIINTQEALKRRRQQITELNKSMAAVINPIMHQYS